MLLARNYPQTPTNPRIALQEARREKACRKNEMFGTSPPAKTKGQASTKSRTGRARKRCFLAVEGKSVQNVAETMAWHARMRKKNEIRHLLKTSLSEHARPIQVFATQMQVLSAKTIMTGGLYHGRTRTGFPLRLVGGCPSWDPPEMQAQHRLNMCKC